MKTTKILISICVVLFLTTIKMNAQVTIGSTNAPHSAAILDLQTTTKGFKLPNVTLDLDDLTQFKLDGSTNKATATGLIVFNTANNTIYVWNGTIWVPMSSGAGNASQNCPSKLFAVSVKGTIPKTACPGYPFTGISLVTTGGKEPYTYSSPDFNTNGTIISGIAMGIVDKVFQIRITDADGCYSDFSFSVALATTCTSNSPVEISGIAGLTFLDRNLGVSTSYSANPTVYNPGTNDSPTGYLNGDYYQWGRKTDGHEKWNSLKIAGPISGTAIVSEQAAGYYVGKFVTGYEEPFDWRSPQNDYLWAAKTTGAKTAYDPCPSGYRVPTIAEWTTVVNSGKLTWDNNKKGLVYAGTNFFLPAAGGLNPSAVSFISVGQVGHYWSSTPGTTTTTRANILFFSTTTTKSLATGTNGRGDGLSIRCIKGN